MVHATGRLDDGGLSDHGRGREPWPLPP